MVCATFILHRVSIICEQNPGTMTGPLRSWRKLVLFLSVSTLVTWNCRKESGTFTVYLTDHPAAFEAVNVEITQVQVQLACRREKRSGWYDLQTRQGIYDLLQLQNVQVVLAEGERLPAPCDIQQIRLILGTRNSVVVNGQEYPLEVPSGPETGIKISGFQLIARDDLSITLDFDAQRSVYFDGQKYILRPVITVMDMPR